MYTENEIDRLNSGEIANEIEKLIEKFKILQMHHETNTKLLFAFFDGMPKFDELLDQYEEMKLVLERKNAIYAYSYPLEEYFLKLINKINEEGRANIVEEYLSPNQRGLYKALIDGKSIIYRNKELASTEDNDSSFHVSVTSS